MHYKYYILHSHNNTFTLIGGRSGISKLLRWVCEFFQTAANLKKISKTIHMSVQFRVIQGTPELPALTGLHGGA